MLQMPESGVGNRLWWFSLKREISAIWQKRNIYTYEWRSVQTPEGILPVYHCSKELKGIGLI